MSIARTFLVLGLVAPALLAAASAQTERPQHALPRLETNESEIVETLRPSSLDIEDMGAVFRYVLGALRERVQVYPTENYYYFSFTHNGVPYTGSFRLGADVRDQGKVHFSYTERQLDWNREPSVHYRTLGAEDGVTVERVAPLSYRVAAGDKAVTFALNDVSGIKPPPGLVKPDETLIGPIFDESGIRFFIVFNARLKIFHYVLDETLTVADAFVTPKPGEPIVIGKRTGFAFYRVDGRSILIGVSRRNSELNTYFDGPFDQLPENFIEGDVLLNAIVAVAPDVKGQVDRLGQYKDGPGRFLIHPYMLYRTEADLAVFHRCMTDKKVAANMRLRCFVIEDEEQDKPNPRPLALKRR